MRRAVLPDREPNAQRIRDYLKTQAAEKPLSVLVERVREAVDELVAEAKAFEPTELSTEVRTDNGDSDAWTPLACLQHVLASNAHVGREVLYVAHTGELPPNEDEAIPDDREALLAMHAEAMDSTYIHLADADPDANLVTTWQHPMFGDLNWREWFLFLRVHARDHTQQLQAMREALRR